MPRNGPLDEQRGHGRSHESRGADALDRKKQSSEPHFTRAKQETV